MDYKENQEVIKVLQVTGGLNLGGAETMVMNLYNHLDRKKVEFDFLVSGFDNYYYESDIPEERSKIFHICKRSESLVQHHLQFYKVIKENKYKIIHFHTQNAFITSLQIIVARLAGAKIIVVHCHNTMDWRSKKMVFLSKIFRPILYSLSTYKLSCGEAAAKWLFGTTKNVQVIPLPVDCAKYRYNKKIYNELRKKEGFENKTIYTHIGRFADVKNHLFLIQLFENIVKYNPDSILFLIGEGDLKEEVKRKVARLKIEDKVIFWGNISDVSNKLQMSDVFLFPSLYEGFPTVVLEAQAAGLPCLISDTITRKIKITNLVEFIDISHGVDIWIKKIFNLQEISEEDKIKANERVAEVYDIPKVVKQIEKIYGGA